MQTHKSQINFTPSLQKHHSKGQRGNGHCRHGLKTTPAGTLCPAQATSPRETPRKTKGMQGRATGEVSEGKKIDEETLQRGSTDRANND